MITEVKEKWNDHRVYYSYVYQFDPVGNRTSLVRDIHQEPVFAQGEPKGGKGKAKRSEVPSYDGNKTKPTFWDLPGHSDFTYTYNEENQLTRVKCVREDTVYIADYLYDNNGNMIRKTEYKETEPWKKETTTYAYDYENRLVKIIYPDNTTSEYRYDGVGKRIQSVEDGQVIKYLYDGLNVIIERDGNDKTIATYVRGLSYDGGIGGIMEHRDR